MSVEQWGILGLVVLLPLLEGVARVRRAHARSGEAVDRVDDVRTSQRRSSLPNRDADDTMGLDATLVASAPSVPPPLPKSVLPPAKSLSRRPASYASSLKGSASVDAHTGTGKAVAADAVAQWLRPVRNLRRAIVVATILGPPTQ